MSVIRKELRSSRSQSRKYRHGATTTVETGASLCLDASRCAARRCGDLGPFLRSAHWRSLYLTPVVRPVRRCFPGNFKAVATLFIGAALPALAVISALATATSRSSSTPCYSRSVLAVHVSGHLHRACSCAHALPGMLPHAPTHPSVSAGLHVGRIGAARAGAVRAAAARAAASKGSASGSVSSSIRNDGSRR